MGHATFSFLLGRLNINWMSCGKLNRTCFSSITAWLIFWWGLLKTIRPFIFTFYPCWSWSLLRKLPMKKWDPIINIKLIRTSFHPRFQSSDHFEFHCRCHHGWLQTYYQFHILDQSRTPMHWMQNFFRWFDSLQTLALKYWSNGYWILDRRFGRHLHSTCGFSLNVTKPPPHTNHCYWLRWTYMVTTYTKIDVTFMIK